MKKSLKSKHADSLVYIYDKMIDKSMNCDANNYESQNNKHEGSVNIARVVTVQTQNKDDFILYIVSTFLGISLID